MKQVTFVITRKDQGTQGDDRIEVFSFDNEPSLYKVVYRTPELRNAKTFVATESHVIDYLEDVLYSLSRDTVPFENFQISTCIHPSVMYHVADLYDAEMRRLIVNMSTDAIHFNVRNQ